jgi:hypothetical protein
MEKILDDYIGPTAECDCYICPAHYFMSTGRYQCRGCRHYDHEPLVSVND